MDWAAIWTRPYLALGFGLAVEEMWASIEMWDVIRAARRVGLDFRYLGLGRAFVRAGRSMELGLNLSLLINKAHVGEEGSDFRWWVVVRVIKSNGGVSVVCGGRMSIWLSKKSHRPYKFTGAGISEVFPSSVDSSSRASRVTDRNLDHGSWCDVPLREGRSILQVDLEDLACLFCKFDDVRLGEQLKKNASNLYLEVTLRLMFNACRSLGMIAFDGGGLKPNGFMRRVRGIASWASASFFWRLRIS
ncbi:hypothetical protein CRG98_011309 [Punica granatum]|uniref:Uncharacterized protein n=1 Tax=Punica granatum TaxID=22663 RepID=A0A2I0KIK1_PUNGR|nr:hypothetical protein CRG98_011309 [Punica granatum]